jgi:hypothetical protein
MKRILAIAAFILFSGLVFGQGFNQAVGIRGGIFNPGIEYRYYLNDSQSLKALLGNRYANDLRGLQLHALTEFYEYDLFDFSYQLVVYYGFGVHAGYESWDVLRTRNNASWYDTRTAFVTGVDGLVGAEYLFYDFPVTAGLEIKPYIDVFGKRGFGIQVFDIAFTIKYLF